MSENMIFCLGDGSTESSGIGFQQNNRIFNVKVTGEEIEKCRKILNDIKIYPTKWIDKKDMTEQEKKDVNGWRDMGGFLKRFDYKEAWANFWKSATQKQKNTILDIKQFDAEIFKNITGIDVGENNSKKKELIAKAQELKNKADELLEQAEKM